MAAASGGAGNARQPRVYSFFGHGSELVADLHTEGGVIERMIDLPEGYTLVFTEECGVMGTLPPHVYKVMADPANMRFFEDPVTHRDKLCALLKKSVFIFKGPDRIPNFHFTFFNDDPAGPGKVELFHSGVIQLPLDPSATEKPLILKKNDIRFKNVETAYRHSVFPDIKAIFQDFAMENSRSNDSNTLNYEKVVTNLTDLKDATSFFLSDFLTTIGPGIYFNPLCRSIFNYKPSNVISVNSNVYNEPSFVQRKLTPKAAKTEKEEQLLAQTEAIMKARSERRGTYRSEMPAYQGLLEILADKRLDATTTHHVLSIIATLSLDVLNSLTSPHNGDYLIHRAVTRVDTSILDSLLEKGVNLSVQNYQLQTPLHIACTMGRLASFVKVLDAIDDPRIVNIKDEQEFTVLMNACDNDHPEMVAALLTPKFEMTLDYTAGDRDGESALHLACREDAAGCVAVILEKHPELLSLVTKHGLTPWDLAIQTSAGNCLKVIKTLAPEFAVLTESTLGQFLKNPKRLASIEVGLPILFSTGFVPTKDDLIYATEYLTKSNGIAIALFDRLNADGLLTPVDIAEFKKISRPSMRTFVNHVKSVTGNNATATAAAATHKNRRQRHRRQTRRLRKTV